MHMEGIQMADQTCESQSIAIGPESRHHTDREVRKQRPAAFRLTREDVREMHFDERDPHGEERVAHGEARVGESRGVDERAVGVPLQTLDGLHELAFVVRLNPAALDAQFACALARDTLDFCEARTPVQLRLALAQQIQIGTV